MHIQKVLNSSVVLVQDDSGEESILLGKGIGYKNSTFTDLPSFVSTCIQWPRRAGTAIISMKWQQMSNKKRKRKGCFIT